MSGSSIFTSILWWIHDTNHTSVNCEGFATKHPSFNVKTKFRHLLQILHSSQYRCINWRMLLSCYCSMKLSRHPDSLPPTAASNHISGQQRYAVSTVQSHTTPERLPGGVFKQPGVTQRVAAAVPRVEISRADPIPHIQPMPGPSSRTVLGIHLVYSQPEMFKFKI